MGLGGGVAREVVWWAAVVVAGGALARRARDVLTTQGPARGYFAPQPPHYAYLGLPYATAPTRFKAPEPPPRWDGLFEATHRIRCHQQGSGSENCLVANVFTPENGANLPVVVMVHDGNFQNGWGIQEPPTRFLKKNLVVVTFNYRLGALGFLCLGISEAPGNAGLKDQVAALYWVRRNIARFGGNPRAVTLYGMGSGAASAQMILLSGLAEDLVQKVVLESGTILSPMHMTYDPISLAFKAADSLEYSEGDDLNTLAQFFENLPAKILSNTTVLFLPCIENDFEKGLLNEDPIKKLKDGSYQKVPIIVIYSNIDGAAIVGRNDEDFDTVPDNFELLLPNNLKFNDWKTRLRIAGLTKEFYFSNDGDLHDNYINYIHDVLYEYPVLKFATLYAEFSFLPVFVMKFSYRSVRAEDELFTDKVFEYVLSDADLGDDELVAQQLMMLLTNFIKIGDPTPIQTTLLPIIWQPVSEKAMDHITINTASVLLFDVKATMISTKKNQPMKFWDHVYTSFYRSHWPVNVEISYE